jgi:DNA-binding CsgD family transcriptional regulator
MARMTRDAVAAGLAAYEAGDWSTASDTLSAVDALPPDAYVTLARARWWLDDPTGAIGAWEQAYTAFLRRRGGPDDRRAAARAAVAIAREYTAALGNRVAANGWLQRAGDAIRDEEPCVESGWIQLAEAERMADPADSMPLAEAGLAAARLFGDPALEIHALARLGICAVRQGRINEGMDRLDAALAAATGGEADDPRILGDVFCDVVEACTLTADMSRVERWLEVFNEYMERHQHPPLLSFCMVCDAEDRFTKGEWDKAEAALIAALEPITAGAQRARCVHPAALLSEIRVSQSRFEEADQLMTGLEDLPEMTIPRASLFLARGEPAVAVAELHRRLNAAGHDNLLAGPILAALTEAEIAHGDLPAAAVAQEALAALAQVSERARDDADAALAAGRVAAADGRAAMARAEFERALDAFAKLEIPLEAARARLEIAQLMRTDEPALAIEEARVALSAFDQIGAVREADTAASLLRELGATGRAGPKGLERLTKREREILGLLGQGLTNAEIAARLFISTKTAAHHVSNVLAKLGVRNRSEAAAYAQRFLAGSDAK